MPTVPTPNRPSSDIHRVRAALKALHDIAGNRVDLNDGPAWDAIAEAHSAWLWSTPDDEPKATPAPAAAQSLAADVDLREAGARALEIVENEIERVTVHKLDHGRIVLDADELRALRAALDAPSSDRGGARDGWQDVLAERRRQIEAEGWTAAHDDIHTAGQMTDAAVCYAAQAYFPQAANRSAPSLWPWDVSWWKPADPRRMLIKAGALILAEIDRLDRATPPTTTGAAL